ncbi:FkbM family methyltransferase [Granulicella sp. 5B5]|uniref:FkbM family methyltransferase n=1 Tax=Granulicella sp. 5B5 TaxID=1617967 RepID=UPI0015F43F53|nr:FkbM family methyltransferase [Granulicella sp. 5B5]QMV19967.1 FkbM family methyltransferase [Granulicella sp. 5B5]
MDGSRAAIETPLREVLIESPAEVRARENHALAELLAAHGGRCVLYGAGTLGRRAVESLRTIGIEPLAVCDGNATRWGELVAGLTVVSPREAAERFGAKAVFFVTIWNDFHWYVDTEAKLHALGCVAVSSYAPLFWRFGNDFMTMLLLNEPPHRLYEALPQVLEAETLWEDAESLAVYRANIRWRALGDARGFPYPAPVTTYFPADLLEPREDEVLVDCGAFDGDTIRQMLEWSGERFEDVYAVEADAVSAGKLAAYVAGLPHSVAAKIHPIACAVGAERCTLRFAMSGAATSTTSDEGVDVECRTLDEMFAGQRVTMIKMDIEGAEYGALLGARGTIECEMPVLAVCVYHTQADVWRIPLLLRSMQPAYCYFLRAYDGDGLQTVLYAVPPQRLRSAEQRAATAVPRKSASA